MNPTRQKLTALGFCVVLLFSMGVMYGPMLIHPRQVYWAIDTHLERVTNHTCANVWNAIQAGWQDAIEVCAPKPNCLITFYGGIQRALGIRVVRDSQRTVVQLDNGCVSFYGVPSEQGQAKALLELDRYLKARQIPMLYVQAPHKVCKYQPLLPEGMKDEINPFVDGFLNQLRAGHCDVLDTREFFKDDPGQHYRWFYKSDLHWTTDYAFLTYQTIVQRMNQSYGFNVEPALYDLQNFQILKRKEAFHGNEFRRVGRFYVERDEPRDTTPKFPTALVQEANGELVNQNDTSGKKILFLCDSFGWIEMKNWLALTCRQLLQMDLRGKHRAFIDVLNSFQPDLVIILYYPEDLATPGVFNFHDSAETDDVLRNF